MNRSYCPELDDPFQVFDMGDRFFAARTRTSLGLMFDDKVLAQEFCDRINASCNLDRRKNDALDWALANEGNGVTCEEIHAALNSPDQMGLLEFEKRMGDVPAVVTVFNPQVP